LRGFGFEETGGEESRKHGYHSQGEVKKQRMQPKRVNYFFLVLSILGIVLGYSLFSEGMGEGREHALILGEKKIKNGTIDTSAFSRAPVKEPGKTEKRPLLFGNVDADPEPSPGSKFRLRIFTESDRETAVIEDRLPGTFRIEPENEKGLFLLVCEAEGYVPVRRYVRPSTDPVEIRLRGGSIEASCGLRWRLETSNGDSCTVRLLEGEDPRDEIADTDPGKFFLGLRALSQPQPPVLERRIQGSISPDGGFAFELSPIAPGGWLFSVEVEGMGVRLQRVYLRPHETRDLGLLELAPPTIVFVKVVDPRNSEPIEGAEVRPCLAIRALPWTVRTDAFGLAEVPVYGAPDDAALQVTKEGFVPRRVRLRGQVWDRARPLEITLEPAARIKLKVPPGRLVFVSEKPPGGFWAETGGRTEIDAWVPRRGRGTEMFVIDPTDWTFSTRPIRNRKVVEGKAGLEGFVRIGREALGRGNVELRGADGAARGLRFFASILGGRFRFERLPQGTYRITIRVGPQIHDNDHEFRFPPITLKEGHRSETYRLPDGRLALRILNALGEPAAYRAVLIRCPPRPIGSAIPGYRISIQTFSDHLGRVAFRGLPPVWFDVIVMDDLRKRTDRATPFKTSIFPSPKVQEIHIQK